jgi:hypothetical protein
LPQVNYMGHLSIHETRNQTRSRKSEGNIWNARTDRYKIFVTLSRHGHVLVQGYSKLERNRIPTTSTVEKGCMLGLGPPQTEAYNKLKDILVSSHVLKCYDRKKPILLTCDACRRINPSHMLLVH